MLTCTTNGVRCTSQSPNSPTRTGDHADPDFDGLENLLELGFAGDPKATSFQLLPTAAVQNFTLGVPVAGDYLTVTFTRRGDLPSLTVEPEFSDDLLFWPTAGVLTLTVDHGDGTETVTYRDIDPVSGGRRLVRIRVDRL